MVCARREIHMFKTGKPVEVEVLLCEYEFSICVVLGSIRKQAEQAMWKNQ